MEEIKDQEVFVNPYVIQMDKFASSLEHLSRTFLNMEKYKGTLSKEELDEMFEKVTDRYVPDVTGKGSASATVGRGHIR